MQPKPKSISLMSDNTARVYATRLNGDDLAVALLAETTGSNRRNICDILRRRIEQERYEANMQATEKRMASDLNRAIGMVFQRRTAL